MIGRMCTHGDEFNWTSVLKYAAFISSVLSRHRDELITSTEDDQGSRLARMEAAIPPSCGEMIWDRVKCKTSRRMDSLLVQHSPNRPAE